MPEAPGLPGADGTDAALIAALNGDAPFMVRIGPPDLTADLETALEALDPVRCAVVRIGNPLSIPLTPRRVMLQLAPDGEEATEGGEAERLLRAVAIRAAGRRSLLVVVEQAETLTPAALALLQLLPELRGRAGPAVRVAFLGSPAFRTLLLDPRFHPIRDHDVVPPPPLPSRRPPEGNRRGAVLGVASVAVALLLATLLLLPRGISPIAAVPAAPAPPPSLPSAATAPPVPAASPAPPRSAAENPAVVSPSDAPQLTSPAEAAAAPTPPRPPAAVAEDTAAARARLRREFNAFVEARGLAGRLSPADRDALFMEYLARRHASTAPAEPVPASSTEPEVLLLFRAGHPDIEARANEDAILLRPHTRNVTVRQAADGPAQPTVRYFRPGDRGLALAIALALPSTTPDWRVVDLSGAADRPVRPTIEVWLPGAP